MAIIMYYTRHFTIIIEVPMPQVLMLWMTHWREERHGTRKLIITQNTKWLRTWGACI